MLHFYDLIGEELVFNLSSRGNRFLR